MEYGPPEFNPTTTVKLPSAKEIWDEIEKIRRFDRWMQDLERQDEHRETADSHAQTFNEEIEKELAEWDKILHPEK